MNDSQQHRDLYLLVGQSNMAGRGKVEPEDQVAHPQIWSLDQADRWIPAIDPVHFDRPHMAGVGLARTFAKQVLERDPTQQIGLIPCAVGGTAIEEWQTDGPLYQNAIRRTLLAQENGTLRGILWHQGEADSTAERSVLYAKRLRALIQHFRRNLDAAHVPFILGELGPFRTAKSEFTEPVNAIIRWVTTVEPRAAFAKSEGLESTGDNTHFNAASLRELGRRYAEAFLKLTDDSTPASAAGRPNRLGSVAAASSRSGL